MISNYTRIGLLITDNSYHISNSTLKDVGDDNWALFYTFSSEVSEKLGFRNN